MCFVAPTARQPFVVFGFSAASLTSMRSNRRSEKASKVAAVAQAKLAEIRADLAAGKAITAGPQVRENIYIVSWTLGAGAVVPISVRVAWNEPTTRTIEFQTVVND